MLLDEDKAVNAFKKVRLVREEYRAYILGADMNVLSVDDFVHTVAQMYTIPIRVRAVDFHGKYIRGMLVRYEDRAEVFVRHTLDRSMQRFTAVKETCHIVLDAEEDWSVDGVKTIGDLQEDHLLQDEVAQTTSQSEILAELAALELMYPHECRAGDQAKLDANETTTSKIALHHKMPEVMVVKALSAAHKRAADYIWGRVTKLEAAE